MITSTSRLLVVLVFVFGIVAPASGATVNEIEVSLNKCKSSLRTQNERIQRDCKQNDQACSAIKKNLELIRTEPPIKYLKAHTEVMDASNRYFKASEEAVAYEKSKGKGKSLFDMRSTDPVADRLLNDITYRKNREQSAEFYFEREKKLWVAEIAKQEKDYKHCVSGSEACQQLVRILASTTEACADFESQLTAARQQLAPSKSPTARPQQQQELAPSSSPTGFTVKCTPNPVPPDGTVSCTALGIFAYSGGGLKEFDLTNDPGTRWENGPTGSAKGLKPGQSFVVRATRDNIADSVTVTVAGAPAENNGEQILTGDGKPAAPDKVDDLIGRWEGKGTILEFKTAYPEVDAMQQGKSFPITISIVPNGESGIKMTSSSPTGFFCNPAEQTMRNDNHVRIDWDGPPPAGVPQTPNMKTTVNCSVDLELTGGRLRGTHSNTSITTITTPQGGTSSATTRMKTSFDVTRKSQVSETTTTAPVRTTSTP
ncbi:MAG: hypothetical protein V2A66_08245 [Pseudomonadota bacterium]